MFFVASGYTNILFCHFIITLINSVLFEINLELNIMSFHTLVVYGLADLKEFPLEVLVSIKRGRVAILKRI